MNRFCAKQCCNSSIITDLKGTNWFTCLLTMLLCFLWIVNVKIVYFQWPAGPWKINQSLKMKCGYELTQLPRLSAVEMERGSQGHLQEHKLCDGWPHHPTSVFPSPPWIPAPILFQATAQGPHSKQANLKIPQLKSRRQSWSSTFQPNA